MKRDKDEIMKEISKKYSLKTYWDYNDSLDSKDIDEALNNYKKEGYECPYNYLVNLLFELSFDYMYEEKTRIIEEALTDDEKQDAELIDQIQEEIGDKWDFNESQLFRNSRALIRLTLHTNEDLIYIPDLKQSETFSHLKRVFKGIISQKQLKEAIYTTECTDYALFTIYFSLRAESLENFLKNVGTGKLKIPKKAYWTFFNKCQGAGGELGYTFKKDFELNLADWTQQEGGCYSVNVNTDEGDSYGLIETYGLVSSSFPEVSI